MDHVHYVPVLLTDLGCREHLCLLLSETMGMALLDTGSSKTVCGKQWLSVYLDTLSLQDRRSVKRTDSTNQFRFGDGHVFHSMGTVYIPIYIGSRKIILCTDTVVCNVPLLLSRETLQRLDTTIDFRDNKVSMLGEFRSLLLTIN